MMDENKDRRAAESDKLADETIVFRREPIKRTVAPSGTQSDMQHTAQIRGGAVIRPLKKAGSTPSPAPAPTSAHRQTSSVAHQAPARQSQPSSAGHTAETVQKRPVQQMSPRPVQQQPPQRRVQTPKPTAPTAPAVRTPSPAAKQEPKPQIPSKIAAPSPAKRTAAPQPAVRRRTENDDYQIDEITYTRRIPAVKPDSAFTDSATSAIMSLVKAVIYIVAVIAVSVGLSVFVINTANDIFKFVVEDKIVTVSIPEYADIDDVADALYDAGAIKYKWAFKLWTAVKDPNAEFVAGDSYQVSTTLNYDYLRSQFKRSTRRVEVRVTIPEGYTVDEIISLLVEKGIGTKEAFEDVIQNYAFDYRFVNELQVKPERIWRLEGYLFPDTYNFYLDTNPDDTASEITAIGKILDNFNRKFVEDYYARCADLNLTVDEAVTLASMIEKETRYASELGDVSSVFHNRLKYKSSFPYLNSDATIMYAIAHDTGSRLDTMTGEDINYNTPYNTYTYKGLPPGPIANPGLNAIKYALYPNSTGYFYFVSDSNGRMLFGKTEAEHIKNINTARQN